VSARAAIRQGDLNRFLKAAKAHGFAVEYDGSTLRLLPTTQNSNLPSPDQPDSDWDKAMGLK
jgi:hypothetical protein